MDKFPVRKWLNVQKQKNINIGLEQAKRFGDKNLNKILRNSSKINKTIEFETQNITDFVTPGIDKVFINIK